MLAHAEPWAAQAWQHWHRPWAVTHGSWIGEAHAFARPGGASELALRLHYPAWCRSYALEPALAEFDDTPWWRLFSLAPQSFEQVAQHVGLTLTFAADRRLRLLRGGAVDVALARWALARAHFVPEPVACAVRECVPTAAAEAHAALSLRWCLDAAPQLWARMRLRFARAHVPADDAFPEQRRIDASTQAHLGKLWRSAMRTAPEGRNA